MFAFKFSASILKNVAPISKSSFTFRAIPTMNQKFFSTSEMTLENRPSTYNAEIEEEYKSEIVDVLEAQRRKRMTRFSKVGIVTSTKNDKTISVRIARDKYLRTYNKWIVRHHKIMAHDEENKARMGDIVRIVPSVKRTTKNKTHALYSIMRRHPSAEGPRVVLSAEQEASRVKRQERQRLMKERKQNIKAIKDKKAGVKKGVHHHVIDVKSD